MPEHLSDSLSPLRPLRGERRVSRAPASLRFCPAFKPFGALVAWNCRRSTGSRTARRARGRLTGTEALGPI
jgi:hypothetical protein